MLADPAAPRPGAVETTELAPGYTISRLIKGGWQLAGGHGGIDAGAAKFDMRRYLDDGITTFDCADIYTGVESLIGTFRREIEAAGDLRRLAQLRVHTKFVPDLQRLGALDRAEVRRLIARSCERLGVERLDLVQFHWWDYAVPRFVEVALWLAELQREGCIELLGGTNFDTAHTAQMQQAGIALATMQVQYSVLDTRPAGTMQSLCARTGLRLLCYGTVAGGFLSERWLGAREPTGVLENRSLVKYRLIIDEIGGWELFQAILSVLSRIADRHGTDIASVATRWVTQQPHVAAAIVGVRHGGHAASHRRLFGFSLDADDQQAIATLLRQRRPVPGEVYELERDRAGAHGRIMKYDLST